MKNVLLISNALFFSALVYGVIYLILKRTYKPQLKAKVSVTIAALLCWLVGALAVLVFKFFK